MLSLLVENYILIISLIGFVYILSNSMKTVNTKKHDRIIELIIVIVFLVISSAFKTYFERLDHYTIGRTITYYICYILRPAVIILFAALLSGKKFVKYLSFLCVINTIIYTTCFFNGLAFSFNEANVLVRGPLCYCAHILCLFYFMVLFSIIIRQHNRQNINRTIILISFMLVCGLASYLDMVYDNVNIYDTAILVCGLEFYLYLFIEYNKIDVLTKTFNRATFYSDIKSLSNNISSVISIDMNNLKTINDTYGHDEGDKAIVTISNILLDVDSRYVRVYRVGGDEFVVLCFYKDKERVLDYIKEAKKRLNKTKYNCSFGYAYKELDDIYEVYKIADNEMYKEKEAYHKKMGISR